MGIDDYNRQPIRYWAVAKDNNIYTVSDGLIEKEVFMEDNKKELYISCQCANEILKVEQFLDEEEVYLSVFRYHSDSTSLWRRLGMCLDVLLGRGVNTADVVISKKDFEELKNF